MLCPFSFLDGQHHPARVENHETSDLSGICSNKHTLCTTVCNHLSAEVPQRPEARLLTKPLIKCTPFLENDSDQSFLSMQTGRFGLVMTEAKQAICGHCGHHKHQLSSLAAFAFARACNKHNERLRLSQGFPVT